VNCPYCNGTGERDTGGFDQSDHPISVECPDCKGTGKVDPRILERNGLLGRIRALQASIDYAAPELEGMYRTKRDECVCRVDELSEALRQDGLL